MFYRPDAAETHFDSAWRSIAEVLFCGLRMNLSPSFRLEEIPSAERDPKHPRHFRYVPAQGVTFVRAGEPAVAHPDPRPIE